MKRLIIVITLLTVTIFINNTVFSQEGGIKWVPVAPISPQTISAVTETIDVRSVGGSGWHIIHKEAPKKFLREAGRATDACLKCHIKDEYKIFDPHKQRNEKGEIIGEKCLYCHVENPVDLGIPSATGSEWHVVHKEAPKRFLKEVPLQSVCFKCHIKDGEIAVFKEIKLIEDSTILCQGCHGKRYNFTHLANAGHLLKPSPKLLGWMKESEKEFDIVFSFDHDGKITCSTCHNPHERGIIPVGMIGSEGAGKESQLRLSTEANKICVACHRDKAGF